MAVKLFNDANTGVTAMDVALRRCGDSAVAVLPAGVLRGLGIKAGQSMRLETTAHGRIVLSPTRRYRLADLLAQGDPKAPAPADLALWEAARPVGQEVW